MKSFGSFAALAAEMTALAVSVEHAQHQGLEDAAKIVETEAKRVLGTHDYGWPALAPETIARKARGDTPLLETGEMRDSIGHKVVDHQNAYVGSNSDRAVWNEMGTSKTPPRPFLLGAATRKEGEVVKAVGGRVGRALIRG